MSPAAAAIVARGLGRSFGPVTALADVDLDVPAGASLAVLGPNGSGKSTLLRLLAGLARPSHGTLRIGDATARGPVTRGLVGYVGHASLLYPALTARENLIFAGRLYGVADAAARADLLLREHGLEPLRNRPAGEFSRGTAQRLSIARGLVHEPAVVLLDEPFAGLDRSSSQRLVERLSTLRAAARTLVFVTHDLSQVRSLADHALVLSRGRVVHRASGDALRPDTLEASYLAAVDVPA